MGFIECKICASKPGSPILCDSCLSNRATIAQLEGKIKELENILSRGLGKELFILLETRERFCNTLETYPCTSQLYAYIAEQWREAD